MSEEKKPSLDAPAGSEAISPEAGSGSLRGSLPKQPPAVPIGPEGKPLQPQIGPDGKTIKGPPLGPDGKPVGPAVGSDGKPLPPPPIIGPDGKEIPRPTDATGTPLPIYVTPEGKPILDADGRPIPLRFDEDRRPLPLELPPREKKVSPEDNIAKLSLWAGSIDLFVSILIVIVLGCIIGTSEDPETYITYNHQFTIVVAGVRILIDVLPFVAWKKKNYTILVIWVAMNVIVAIGAIAVVCVITNTKLTEPPSPYSQKEFRLHYAAQKINAADTTVLVLACVSALGSLLAVLCIKCECKCEDDGSIRRGNQYGGNRFQGNVYGNSNNLYPSNKNPPVSTGAPQQQQPQQQQQMQPQQSGVGGNTTTIITMPSTYGYGYGYNPMMMGGYGFGGYPYYGGFGGMYAPYYDYGWGMGGFW